jgi:hypothetical protein
MSTLDRFIEGKHDLAQINLQINQQEAAALQFQSSQVAPKDNKPGNRVTFEELEPGTVPPRTTIVKDGDPPPSGKEKVWSGTMVVKDSLTAVTGHRAQ